MNRRQRRAAASQINASVTTLTSPLTAAMSAHQRGDFAAAEAGYRALLVETPGSVDAMHYLGLLLSGRGQLDEGGEIIRESIRLCPNHAPFRSNFGLVLWAQGKLDDAAAELRLSLQLQPDFPVALCNLGNVLLAQGKLEEAMEAYQKSLRLQPNYAEAHSNIGAVLSEQGKTEEAIAHYQAALADGVRHAPLHFNLGNALSTRDRYDAAIEQYRLALEIDPRYVDACHNMGAALHSSGRAEEAFPWYEKTLELAPTYAKAHFHLGMLQLAAGDFEAGWLSYAWRFLAQPKLALRAFPQPEWKGEPLDGRRILLHPEQGLGDTLQFLRYVPIIERAGGRVLLQVQPCLRRLAEQMAHRTSVQVFDTTEALADFDLHCPLLGIPAAVGTRMASIPAQVPYLAPPATELAQAEAMHWPASGLRVGLVWAGNSSQVRDRFRSLPLTAWEPILRVEGVHLFSLQIGPPAAQVEQIAASGIPIVNLEPDPDNMADAAAKMLQLDLVITVCTAPAHLAGALAIPTWVMLEYVADWRWFQDRDDSPWYPTARLFRQQTRGDWVPVVATVARELARLRDDNAARPVHQHRELTHR